MNSSSSLSHLEDHFLVLLHENDGIFPMYERWDVGTSALSQGGKLLFWYAGKLNIGSKTLLKMVRRFLKGGLIVRKDCARINSPVMRYVLTETGKQVALQIKMQYEAGPCLKPPKECYVKVLTKSIGSKGIEQPLFAIKKGNILSLENVTLEKEALGNSEFVITRGDTTIVTVRKEHKDCKEFEILIKGYTFDAESIEKAKRYALLLLRKRERNIELREICKFVPLMLLPDDYFSEKNRLRKKTKKLIEEWKEHSLKET